MKHGLFARPNLKILVAVAVLILALDHFLGDAASKESDLFMGNLSAASITDLELERLIERSLEEPTSANFTLISDCYRRRGENQRAMHYLRKAIFAAELERED